MNLISIIKEYWTQLLFLFGILSAVVLQMKNYKNATLCGLRNDILEIWDKCKSTETITRYQLESYTISRDLYFKWGGDGFVHALDSKILAFKIVD